MSDRYPFTGDRTFAHNGTLVWNDQVAVQPSLDFSHVSDSTLTDSMNDTYATAVEDNETQYLSVLESTNDITLDDLHNITLENSKITTQENLQFENITPMENLETNVNDTNDQQVIVFSVDGSDELYGIQFAQDEEGNTQRYQFKFRTTEEGQLEAIPESIQLLADDLETQQKDTEEEILVQETVDTEVTETQVFYQNEPDMLEAPVFEEQVQEEMAEEQVREDQQGTVQMFIKGEPHIESGYEEEEPTDGQIYMEGPMRDEEVGDEEEVYVEKDFEEEEEEEEEETVDIKPGILEENSASAIKEEMFQDDSQDVADPEPSEEEEYQVYNHIDVKPVPYSGHDIEEEVIGTEEEAGHHLEGTVEVDSGYVQVDEAQETVLEYEHYVPEEIQHVYEAADTPDGHVLPLAGHQRSFNQVFIKEDAFRRLAEAKQAHLMQSEEDEEGEEQTYYAEATMENDSDNDDYQIVEGLHVTAEGDIDQDGAYHEPETILQEVAAKKPPTIMERANILKQSSLVKVAKEARTKSNKTVVYYVVPHVEKENVNSLSVNYTTATATAYRQARSNPRSILKSSFPEIREEPETKAAAPVVDERFNKRFARSKEAVQARLFNNFISKTTIPHAPVRQTRLPRKQLIKPVDNRRDEEIIVQEVMVGSNGFIENVEEKLRNKDKLEVTQYVILSDSDEDYDPKKSTKKKKKHKRHTRSSMEETEDSDISIIEIPSDDEETRSDQQESPKRGRGRPKKYTDSLNTTESTKRRRGRPPKSGDTEESPQKKSRTESDEVESDTTKKEFKCPHCTKTFPSQNSLSTHIHHHSLENSLRNSRAAAARQSMVPEYRHKCDECQETFKNSILLKRHVCAKSQAQTQKASKRAECGVCKRSFADLAALKVHKRTHVKENLVNTTAVHKVSPKKVTSRPSTTRLHPKSPKKSTSAASSKSTTTTFKCKDCSRVCFSQEGLDLHEKTHRKYTCATCAATFSSRLLLDTHVRVSCVKASPQLSKRLSFKIRKSYVQSPRRKSVAPARRSLVPKRLDSSTSTKLSNPLNLNLVCEHCGEKFTMFQDHFKHQVKMHGLETPDKSLLKEPKRRLHKPKGAHSGIPAREGMRKIFAEIRSKMALITPKKDAD